MARHLRSITTLISRSLSHAEAFVQTVPGSASKSGGIRSRRHLNCIPLALGLIELLKDARRLTKNK